MATTTIQTCDVCDHCMGDLMCAAAEANIALESEPSQG